MIRTIAAQREKCRNQELVLIELANWTSKALQTSTDPKDIIQFVDKWLEEMNWEIEFGLWSRPLYSRVEIEGSAKSPKFYQRTDAIALLELGGSHLALGVEFVWDELIFDSAGRIRNEYEQADRYELLELPVDEMIVAVHLIPMLVWELIQALRAPEKPTTGKARR